MTVSLKRHIVSVFKLVKELLEPSGVKGKTQFQMLMYKLPPEHKAKWFAGAALNSSEQAMASVMSTVLSRLNAFLDSDLSRYFALTAAHGCRELRVKKSLSSSYSRRTRPKASWQG